MNFDGLRVRNSYPYVEVNYDVELRSLDFVCGYCVKLAYIVPVKHKTPEGNTCLSRGKHRAAIVKNASGYFDNGQFRPLGLFVLINYAT